MYDIERIKQAILPLRSSSFFDTLSNSVNPFFYLLNTYLAFFINKIKWKFQYTVYL